MKLKRLLSLTGFLTAILMFTGGSLHAADLIRVGSAQAFAGGNDTVSVYVTTDEAYNAVEILLSFDPAKFNYEEASLVYDQEAWNPAWGAPEVLADSVNGTVEVSFVSLTVLDAAVPQSAVALKLFSVVLNVAEGVATGTETITPSGTFFSRTEEYDPVEHVVTNLTAGSFLVQTAFTISVEENVQASPGYATPVNIYLTNAEDAVGVQFTLTFDSNQLEYAETVELNQEAWQDGTPQPVEVTPAAGEVQVVIYGTVTAKIPVSNDPRWIAKVYLETADGAAETAVNPLTLTEGIVVTVDEFEPIVNSATLLDGNFEILAKQSLRVSTDAAAPQGGSDTVKVYLKNSETAVGVEAELKFDADQFTADESSVVFNKAIFSGSEAGVTVTLLSTDSTVNVTALPAAQDSIAGSDVEKDLFSVVLQVKEDATPASYDLDISGMLTTRDENYDTEELPITSVTKGAFLVRSPFELQVQSLTALPLTKQTVNILLTNRDLVIGAELVVRFDSDELTYEEGSLVVNSDIWSAGAPITDYVDAGTDSVAVGLHGPDPQTEIPAGGSGQVLLSLDFTLVIVLAVGDTAGINVEGLVATHIDYDPQEEVATGISGYIAVSEEVGPPEPEEVTYLKVMPVVAAAGGAANSTKVMLYSVEKDVAGIGFKFKFDQTKIQLTSVAEGADVPVPYGVVYPIDLDSANTNGEFILSAIDTSLANPVSAGQEAEIVVVGLQVLEGVATGQIPLTLEEASLSDTGGVDIPVTVTNGYVNVVIPTGADLNKDGVIDARDLWYYLNNPITVLIDDLAACIAELLAQPLPSTMLASAQDAVYTASAADGAALINLNTDFEIIVARFTFSYDNSYGVADVQLSQALAGKVFIKKMFVEGKLVVDIISLTGLVPAELGSEMFSVAFRGASHEEAALTLEKVEVADRSGKVYIEAAKVNAAKTLPKVFALSQNSPNPFNPSTTISYEIPESSDAVKVVMAVYNIRGQKVITLVDELKEAGQYSVNWNGRNENGRRVSSGVYFYRMSAGDFTAVRKMVIVK
ncbi:MAG: hypothetical protein AMJ46_13655 [Latescibacteria bacterium DG_63]|nr:MAG: hypothetical protein AMJ46_13655 [Latescibacteria bacterium DG_63]